MMDRITKNREGEPIDIKIGVDLVLGIVKHKETGQRLAMVSIIEKDGCEVGIPLDAEECRGISKDLLEVAANLEAK